MLVCVVVGRGCPIGICTQFVSQDPRTAKSKRKALTVSRIRGRRRVAQQYDAVAIRMFHPELADIETREWPNAFGLGVVVGEGRIASGRLAKKQIPHLRALQA